MQLAQLFNLGIAIAYFSIPLALGSSVVRNWQQIPSLLRLTLVAFALFIAACGSGHGLMAFMGHRGSPLLTLSHGITFAISAPVALAFPAIAGKLRQILLQNQRLARDLKQSEATFHGFLDAHPKLLAWIKDEQLINTYSNQALIQAFGLNPLGQRDEEWLPLSTANAVAANDRHVLSTGQTYEGIEVVATPDGVVQSWLSYKFLLQINGQPFVGGTATNVTEQEQLRREVDIAFRELEEFTYAASHDLKTPLRGINGLLTILERKLEGKLSDYDRSLFLQIRRDCDYAIDLVNGILAYSKVGQTQIRRVAVDVDELLAGVCSRFTERLLALGASIDWQPEMPLMFADQTQLQQIFENLIDNALKYRSSAPPVIRVSLSHRAGEWIFAVQDNGLGVALEDQERLFVMFARLHSRSEIEGTGIGLATVRKIAQRHGGSAWLESAGTGCGSTVYVSIRGAV